MDTLYNENIKGLKMIAIEELRKDDVLWYEDVATGIFLDNACRFLLLGEAKWSGGWSMEKIQTAIETNGLSGLFFDWVETRWIHIIVDITEVVVDEDKIDTAHLLALKQLLAVKAKTAARWEAELDAKSTIN